MDDQNPFQLNLSELQAKSANPTTQTGTNASIQPEVQKSESAILEQPKTPPVVETSEKNKDGVDPQVTPKSSHSSSANQKTILIVAGILVVAFISIATAYFKTGPAVKGSLNDIASTQSQQTQQNHPTQQTQSPLTTQSEVVTNDSQITMSCDQIGKELDNINQILSTVTDPQAKQDLQNKIDQLKKSAFDQECKLIIPDDVASATLHCASGQLADTSNNRCVCDKQNGYYPVTIQNAFVTSISTDQVGSMCLSCSQITKRLDTLNKNPAPPIPTTLTTQTSDEKTILLEAAQQNNCNVCAGFDEKIKNAFDAQQWIEYDQAINTKLDDKTCGKNLSPCDAAKWKLIFTIQLKEKLKKESQKNLAQLDTLEQKIKTLRGEILQNSCVDITETCQQLSQENSTQTDVTTAPAEIDLTTYPSGQLFSDDRAFKLVHCRNVKTKGFKRPPAPSF